ncbi:MAG: crossover junction endodeoxyribonuclease RuvC [Gammaproteobacteria bacterium]|nr:crossover junction endodeoxyribonuclease RuvC [Gammaproteobacteria bacterium]
MTVILGIDPGSRNTGYGVISMAGDRAAYLHSGTIKLPEDSLSERLCRIHDHLSEVIAQYAPVEAAIERVFVNRNPDSALKLGQARGAAIVALGHAELPVHEYSPNQIKQAIVGRGHAEKSQVGYMVRMLLNLSRAPQADEADALAVAICHGHTRRMATRLAVATAAVSGTRRR